MAGQHAKLVARIAAVEARSPDISTVVVPEDMGATAQMAQKPTQILRKKELIPKVSVQKVVSAIAALKIATKINEVPKQAKVGLPIDSSRRSTVQPAQVPPTSTTPATPSKDMTATNRNEALETRTGRADQLMDLADESLEDADKFRTAFRGLLDCVMRQ